MNLSAWLTHLWPWFQAFAFTQVVEVPIYIRALPPVRSIALRALIGFGASTLTHPLVWFVFPHLPGLSFFAQMTLAETFAVVVEAGYLSLFGLRNAFAWSLLANGASLGLGLLSRHYFGHP